MSASAAIVWTEKIADNTVETMKITIVSAVCLLIGLLIGLRLEHRHAEQEDIQIVDQFTQAYDSKASEEAARDVLAIGYVESGDKQNAAQLLSTAVAEFYCGYVRLPHNRKQTIQVLARIEQVASTNHIVADEITNQMHLQ